MSFAPMKNPDMPRETPALMRFLSWPIITFTRLIQDLRVSGQHNIPASGPVLFVANHTSHLDPFIIGVALYEAGIAPQFVAKKEVFNPVTTPILNGLKQIKIDRKNPAGSVDNMIAALDAGGCLVVFPEGTFTRDPYGWPMTAKTGIARIAQARPDIPIIPVAHWGNERLIHQVTGRFNMSRIAHRSERVYVNFGPAIDLSGENLQEQANSAMRVLAQDVARLRKKLGRPVGEPPSTSPYTSADPMPQVQRDR